MTYEDVTEVGSKSRLQTASGSLFIIMAKKRLTFGARVRHKKNGASDCVIRSSLGRGKWMIKWSDKEEQKREVTVEALLSLRK